MITKEQIESIYDIIKEKPERFHHICYGGSTTKMVDVVSAERHYTCRYQGNKNWITPICENCKGLDANNEELTDYQRMMNYGIDKFYNALLRCISDVQNDLNSKAISILIY